MIRDFRKERYKYRIRPWQGQSVCLTEYFTNEKWFRLLSWIMVLGFWERLHENIIGFIFQITIPNCWKGFFFCFVLTAGIIIVVSQSTHALIEFIVNSIICWMMKSSIKSESHSVDLKLINIVFILLGITIRYQSWLEWLGLKTSVVRGVF